MVRNLASGEGAHRVLQKQEAVSVKSEKARHNSKESARRRTHGGKTVALPWSNTSVSSLEMYLRSATIWYTNSENQSSVMTK